MPLINCEINLIITLSANCFQIPGATDYQVPTFAITDTKLYVPVVTLSIQDNVKLLQQLNSGFCVIIRNDAHRTSYKIFFFQL